MAGWHHWLDGHESQWTLGVGDGQGGLACCDSWGRKESDTTERLIWSDLTWYYLAIKTNILLLCEITWCPVLHINEIIQYVLWLILINVMILTSMLGLLESVCNSSQVIVYISSQLDIQWCHIGSSKLAMVGVFIWWKLANGHKSEEVENPKKLIFYFNVF